MVAVLPTRKIIVSAAKRTVRPGGRTLGRSFMKSEKRVGPRTEPFGTPEVVAGEGVELNTRVTWKLHEFFLTRNTCSIHESKSLRNTANGGCRLPHELPHQQRSAFLNKDDIFLLLIYRVRRRGNLSLTRRTRTLSSWSTAANKTR